MQKMDSGYYKKTSIMAIRAAIARFLRVEHKKPFPAVGNSAFSEANLSLIPSLKIFAKLGKLVG